MMETNGNGASAPPQDYRSFMEEEAKRLAQVLIRAEAEAADIKIKLMEAEADVRSIRKAMEALTGEAPAKTASKSLRKSRDNNRWQISEAKIQEVWNIVRAIDDETFTTNSVATAQPGLSQESARRALDILRERQLIRLAGKARGGGKLLAIMPGAEDTDDASRH